MDVDPEIVIAIEKFVLLRRAMAKDSELQQVVKDICDVYTDFGFQGIRTTTTDLTTLKPAPPAGHPERRKWESSDPELGLIGLILSTVYRMGAALDVGTMTIHQRGEVTTSFLAPPPQPPAQSIAESYGQRTQSRSARSEST